MENRKNNKKEHLEFDTKFLDNTTQTQDKTEVVTKKTVSIGMIDDKPKTTNNWFANRIGCFIILLIVGSIWGAIQNSLPWVDFTSASGHFKAQFPSQPIYEKSDNFESYTSKNSGNDSSDYSVWYLSLAGVGTIDDPVAFLKAFNDKMFGSQSDITVVGSTPSYYGSYHSLDVKFYYSNKGKSEYMKVKMILTSDMLYLVSSDYFTENTSNDDKFFKSFKIIN